MSHHFESGFTVRKPAWHGLGTVLDDYPRSIEEARIAAGLTWEPVLEPCFHQRPGIGVDPNGQPISACSYVEVPDAGLVVRDDTQAVIGYGMSSSYQPITNTVMFELLEALVGEGMKIETAGVLKGGSQVWALAYLDEPYHLPHDPSVSMMYIAVVNSHDGTMALRAERTQVRIVCANTVQMSALNAKQHGTGYTFRHTANVMDRIDEARNAINGLRADRDDWLGLAAELDAINVTPAVYQAFIDEFIPRPAAAIVSDRVQDNITEARTKFGQLYDGEQNEQHRGTGLGLVNSAVEYLDHIRGYRNRDTYLSRTVLRPELLKAKAVNIVRKLKP